MKIPSKACIELNNKGTEYMMNYPMNGKDGLLKAIDFFNQAIDCEPSFLLAYENLAHAYGRNQDYKKELSAYNKALTLSNNDPSIITEKAEVFEKMSMLDSAKRDYQFARQSFGDSLSNHPDDANLVSGFVLVIALTEGKDAAIKELNAQLKMHRSLSSKLSYEYAFYKDFDRHAYIYGLTVETK
ncbi:hypothetical protein MgSA37_01193 [Mucilaginibacter gotjawali]|nr:hypothetical protein MgSA37_01193 [Mucilaginibacter gotjawali]